MNWKVVWADHKSHVAFTLFLIWILAAWHLPAGRQALGLIYPLLAIAVVLILDLAITWVRTKKVAYFPSASLVTGFLIGLILSPTEPVWVVVVAAVLASLSKQLIAAGPRQHIFNPAAFGIVSALLIFGTEGAWWAVAWSKWPLLVLVPLMIRILWKMKRLTLPITFFVFYFSLITLISPISPTDSLKNLADGTLLLFALVMLTEPITSPAVGKFKFLFGPLVAVFALALGILGITTEVFLPALLLANLAGFVILRTGAVLTKDERTKK